MTPEQALQFLKQMADAANAPLQAHATAQEAFNLLEKELVK